MFLNKKLSTLKNLTIFLHILFRNILLPLLIPPYILIEGKNPLKLISYMLSYSHITLNSLFSL